MCWDPCGASVCGGTCTACVRGSMVACICVWGYVHRIGVPLAVGKQLLLQLSDPQPALLSVPVGHIDIYAPPIVLSTMLSTPPSSPAAVRISGLDLQLEVPHHGHQTRHHDGLCFWLTHSSCSLLNPAQMFAVLLISNLLILRTNILFVTNQTYVT